MVHKMGYQEMDFSQLKTEGVPRNTSRAIHPMIHRIDLFWALLALAAAAAAAICQQKYYIVCSGASGGSAALQQQREHRET